MFAIINYLFFIAIILCSEKKKVHFFDEIHDETKARITFKCINPLFKKMDPGLKLPPIKEENIKYHQVTRKRLNEIDKNPDLISIYNRDTIHKYRFKKNFLESFIVILIEDHLDTKISFENKIKENLFDEKYIENIKSILYDVKHRIHLIIRYFNDIDITSDISEYDLCKGMITSCINDLKILEKNFNLKIKKLKLKT